MTTPNEHGRAETPTDAADPRRQAERDGVAAEVAARLRASGVALDDRESGEDLVTLLDAVERFERAVIAQGGDLMVDEGPGGRTSEPDDPAFVIPRRAAGESVPVYLDRLDAAVAAVQRRAKP